MPCREVVPHTRQYAPPKAGAAIAHRPSAHSFICLDIVLPSIQP